MKVSELLDKAADQIEPEGAWTKRTLARDDRGKEVLDPADSRATCWCVAGAMQRVAGVEGFNFSDAAWTAYDAARNALIAGLGVRGIADWNDAPGRSQAEIVAALREVARKEREAGR